MNAEERLSERHALLAQLDARFRLPLMRYFVRRVGDRSEAEDLTQQVFVRIIGAETRLSADQADGLIFITARNLLTDRSRRNHYRLSKASIPITGMSDGDLSSLSADGVEDRHPERVLIAKDTLEAAVAALDRLGTRTKDIFVLTRLENMKQADVARLLGISVSAVEKHLVRAVAHLASTFRVDER